MIRFIPTPIGNLEDITHRSLKALQEAEVVFCEDSRMSKKLFTLLHERFGANFGEKKYVSMHSHNEQEVLDKTPPSLFEQNCVYVSDAGMPCISDPGYKLIEHCIANNIKYEVYTGANALLPSVVASGFDTGRFVFWGFLPHKGSERQQQLLEALQTGYTTVLYESPHRLLKLLQEIAAFAPTRELFLAKELTKLHESFFRGSASHLTAIMPEQNIKGEWVVVIQKSLQKSTAGAAITEEDVKALEISDKQKAKLLAKLRGVHAKECYKELIEGK